MIAYFDTSALVKLLVREHGSENALRVWEAAEAALSSVLLYPETRAALRRAWREQRLGSGSLRLALVEFERVWQRLDRVAVTAELAEAAGALAHAYDLRGYDAVHLASAALVRAPERVFVAADRALCAAAARLGLPVVALDA